MDISYTARLLYALFLDRSALSQKNGWTDNEGRVFIVYPITEIAEILDKGTTTIKSALNELDAAGLLSPVMRSVTERAEKQVKRRAGELSAELVIYTNARGILGQSGGAAEMLKRLRETEAAK